MASIRKLKNLEVLAVTRFMEVEQKVLSVQQAAQILGTTPTLIRKMIDRKTLRAVRLSERKTVIPITEIERVLGMGSEQREAIQEESGEYQLSLFKSKAP